MPILVSRPSKLVRELYESDGWGDAELFGRSVAHSVVNFFYAREDHWVFERRLSNILLKSSAL